MSVENLLEQALQEGSFSSSADAGAGKAVHETLLKRMRALQGKDIPAGKSLEAIVQSAGELSLSRRDANTLYFCDQLFEQCQMQTDLEPALLEPFLQLRPLLAGVMLRDPAALQSFQHPLYQLLDQLWDASRYWSPELGRQGEKYRARLDDMQKKLRVADPEKAPFQAWLDEISTQLEKDTQRAETLADRICQAERGTLASQQAERVVRRELNRLLALQPMPETVEELFKGPLRSSLQMAYLNQGLDSKVWKDAVSAAELLLESLKIPEGEEEKQHIYQLIPKIPALIGKTLTSISDAGEMDEWQRKIEALHMQVLLDGKSDARPAELLAMIEDGGNVNANISGALLEQVAQIPEGQWLIYQKENDECLRCRLAMKMEEAGQMLFVNVLGAKCLEKTTEEFAYLLAARLIRLLNADNNFSQILRDTVSHFLQLRQRQALLQADAAERARKENERRHKAQEKARLEAERIAMEKLAARARAEEQARLVAEEQAKRAAEEATRAAEEAKRASAEMAKHAAKLVAEDAARKKAEAEHAREHALLKEKQARLNEWEETQQAVRSMGVGAWIELEIEGAMQKCKLAAVINASDKLIFVGRDGRKMAEPRRDELIKMMLDGKALIIERGDQFENSLARVIQTLRKD